ncbi:hypothetical protein P7C71_g4125, partial [Lecanoromycetidae sp. Uapishka_2]
MSYDEPNDSAPNGSAEIYYFNQIDTVTGLIRVRSDKGIYIFDLYIRHQRRFNNIKALKAHYRSCCTHFRSHSWLAVDAFCTSTIFLPSGFGYASTEAGGFIVFTNGNGAVSTSINSALPASYSLVIGQPTTSESPTTSSTSSPPSTSSSLSTSIPLSTSRSISSSIAGNTALSSQSADSTHPHPTLSTLSPAPPSDNRLPNGTVAGIVIAVALGLAFIACLATYLILRRKRSFGAGRHDQEPREDAIAASDGTDKQSKKLEPKGPLITEASSRDGLLAGHLPQSADDKTVQNIARTTLDQIELHVENFYERVARSSIRFADADIAAFNSPFLSDSLGTLLTQSSNAVPLIKHALAHFITDSISLIANPNATLLPDEYVLLPSTVKAASAGASPKIAERDQRIGEIVQLFSRAFGPWKSPKYSDEERIRSLSATLKDAADLGLFMFAQPSDLQFRWSKQSELGPNTIATTPALIKLTDEKGNALSEPQVMLKTVMHRT